MKHLKLVLTLLLISLTSCKTLGSLEPQSDNKIEHCVEPQLLYKTADKRIVNAQLFEQALNCEESETVKIALVALGRIGGKDVAALISSKLNSPKVTVRQTAAFAAGISLNPSLVGALAKQLEQEINPSVQKNLAMAIGNLGHKDSASILYSIINHKFLGKSTNDLAAQGAMQGLGILALFHGDKLVNKKQLNVDKVLAYLNNPTTSLEASFLLARVPILNSSHTSQLKQIIETSNNDAQAFGIRAFGNLKSAESFDWLLSKALSNDIGVRVSAIQALGRLPIGDSKQIAAMNQLALSKDWIAALTTLQSAAKWLTLTTLNQIIDTDDSWLQAQAFSSTNDPKPKAFLKRIENWLQSDEVNLQRAAIAHFVKVKDNDRLKQLAKSESEIIAKGAKQALKIVDEPESKPLVTPESLPKLPATVSLKTTKGIIVIQLFTDTPYSSTNFIKLSKEGFYNNSYFHRVIPNFVAQGGGKIGDGSSTVGYSIREELNSRSHSYGTVGMATSGKDTGGGQFFINLAPNLHLDNNYTVFGKVIKGMDVALQLEQNDQVLKVMF